MFEWYIILSRLVRKCSCHDAFLVHELLLNLSNKDTVCCGSNMSKGTGICVWYNVFLDFARYVNVLSLYCLYKYIHCMCVFQGFETRGTPIHNAAYTLKNLWQHKDDQYFITPNASYMCEKLHIPESLRNNPLNPFSKLCLPNRNRRSTGNSHLRLLQGVKGRNLASDLAILSRGAAENGHHAGRHPRDIDGDESDEMCGHYSISEYLPIFTTINEYSRP